MDKKKYKKRDLQCYSCSRKFNYEEQKMLGNVEIYDDYTIFWCECGEQTFVHKGIGYKSHKIN